VNELREQLEAAGYRIAKRPYNVRWFAASGEDYLYPGDEAKYSIDLERAVFIRWGEPPIEKPVSKLLSAGQREVQRTQKLGPFIDRCLARGFVIDRILDERCNHHVGDKDTGSRFAIWRGQRVLLCPQTEVIIDRQFVRHTLDKLVPVTVQRIEVVYSGRAAQPSLF
jgi:hypothetical protein